ncbi:hypothetical protein EYF80_056641 [Liparis tanakae]|uniref:Uncharacterized protein n=1 Tax=Liparis tanakae TaxID=230148 RepID=A0A4Z2EW71_9TELE|nr:hypothetical protein EYF80_056641 [Liparis tanakae]
MSRGDRGSAAPTGPGDRGSAAPTGLADRGSASAPMSLGDEGAAAPTGLPHSLVLEALHELAVSLGLVPPHRCDPLEHLLPAGELFLWLLLRMDRNTPGRGPHVGLQCDTIPAVGFPPKHQGYSNTNEVLFDNIFI